MVPVVLVALWWWWPFGQERPIAEVESTEANESADVSERAPVMDVSPETSRRDEGSAIEEQSSGRALERVVIHVPEGQQFVRTHSHGATTGPVPPGMVRVPRGVLRQGVTREQLFEFADLLGVPHGELANDFGALTAMYPAHEVLVDELFMDQHETTNQQFAVYLEAVGATPDPNLIDLSWTFWRNGVRETGIPPGQESFPVRGVSAMDALACARWMGKRLPIESEWECAARGAAGNDTFYVWAQGWKGWDPKRCANARTSNRGELGIHPFAVGSFEDDVSEAGLRDVCGNVGEWTASPFVAYPGYEPITMTVRREERSFQARFNEESWTVRGGSCRGNEITNNVVVRWGVHPRTASEFVGFRPAASVFAGLDPLRDAASTSGQPALASAEKPGGFLGQQVWVAEPGTQLILHHRFLAFESDPAFEPRDPPTRLGVLVLSHPIEEPPIPAGRHELFWTGTELPVLPTEVELSVRVRSRLVPVPARLTTAVQPASAALTVSEDPEPTARLAFDAGETGLRVSIHLELPRGYLVPTPR